MLIHVTFPTLHILCRKNSFAAQNQLVRVERSVMAKMWPVPSHGELAKALHVAVAALSIKSGRIADPLFSTENNDSHQGR